MCGGSSTSYVQSPEQKQIYTALLPMIQKMTGFTTGNGASSLYDISGAPEYAGYEVPDTSSMMPTGNWWENLDPNIKSGITQPFQEGADQLGEQLLSFGEGSQMGGASGSMAAGLGNYWAKAAPQMATTGWDMVSPALQQGWQANLLNNMNTSEKNYSTDMAEWNAKLNMGQLPYNLLGSMMGGTYSTPVVSQDTTGSALGGLAGTIGAALIM
jgi:hypothetical protein